MAANQTVQFSYKTALIEGFEILTDEQCQAISKGSVLNKVQK
ncbi:hypothetical protein [Nostoc sp. ChiVER01]|nr:hypothetical protein [Nostoc sp. ChiVER01]MDZ8221781.1 hypothetical protein [Nostoc sp. ChiVER01]